MVAIIAVGAVVVSAGVIGGAFMFLTKMQVINKKIDPKKIRIFSRL